MNQTGRVLAIALKTAHGGPMREVEEAEAVVDGGLIGSARPSPKRGITFLSREAWEAALDELGADLPWHTRRANVLVEGFDFGALIGKTVRVGTVELTVRGETKPCDQMDAQHPGLQRALKPERRGGVYGQVTRAGRVRVGDSLTVLPEPARSEA